MLHRVKYCFLFFFIIPSFLFPQSVKSVQVKGASDFASGDIINWSGIGSGTKIFSGIVDTVKKKLAFNLGERGYFNSSFEGTHYEYEPDSQQVVFYIDINEGSPTYIRNINIVWEDSTKDEDILSMFQYMVNQVYDKFELESAISNVLTYYENNGYPFAKIIISSVKFLNDSTSKQHYANIYLKIDKGLKSKIDKIEIIGNSKTADYVIARELRIKLGELYSQKIIDELPDRLNRLGFFEPVNSPNFYINSSNKGVLVINVKEKQTNNFDGIIGYIPGNGKGEPGYITGLVNVSLRNLFGTGRAAAIRWQQYNRASQNLQLKYLEPWLFGYPFNLTGNLEQRKQDTTYVQRTLGVTLEYLANESVSAAVFISTESVIPTVNANNIFSVYNSSSVTTGINLKIDTRDDPYSPTRGFLFMNTFSFSQKKINGPAAFITPALNTNFNLRRITLDLDGFYELFNRQVAALGLHGRDLQGSFLEVSDLFRLGGAKTLRGYREDQFLGSRIFWSNLEYRLLLQKRTYGFIFFDTGYYYRKAEPERNILKQKGFKIGYGLGLNLETGLGVINVSFALAKGDSFSDGKIHFGLVNEF